MALSGRPGCASTTDVVALPAASKNSTRRIFDSAKLEGDNPDYRKDSAIFTCTQATCGGDAIVMFQMITLTDKQKRPLQTDRRKGYSALADEATRYFIQPSDPCEGTLEANLPIYAEQRGRMALHQTVTIPSPSDPSRKAARLVMLADRAQSHVLVAYSPNKADAAKAGKKILRA